MRKRLSDMSLAELKKMNLGAAIGFAVISSAFQIIGRQIKSIPLVLVVVIISSIGGYVCYILMMWIMKKKIKR